MKVPIIWEHGVSPKPVFYEEDDDIAVMVNDLSDENLDVTAFSQTDLFVNDFTVDNIFSNFCLGK